MTATGVNGQRFPLLSSSRLMLPVALLLGIAGFFLANGHTPRLIYGAGTLGVVALWLLTRAQRPVLVVDDEGYAVEVRGRRRLQVLFSEVKRVRAVPVEQAMYVDCGDPSRNLLLPTRHGYPYRFARQSALYVLLARRLEDRIEIADKLVPDPPVTNGHNKADE